MTKTEFEIKAYTIEHDVPVSDVPCNSINCNECCVKLSPFLTAEEFASGKYIYTFLDSGDGTPSICIPRTDRGCVYLVDGTCSIYETRPLSCRQFDCRKGHSPVIENKFVEKKMKINIGAGDKRYEGYINIDYDVNTNPDYALDIEKEPLPFGDNTVDEVIAHHILEHLGEGYFHVLQEIYRVCKHGAIVDIVVPHHNHDFFKNDPTHRRPITPDGLWLFSKKYNDLTREQGAAASKLGYYYNVDFEVVDVFNVPDRKYIPLFEGKPVEEVERYMSEHNNIVEQVNIKLVVIKNV